MEIFLKIAEMGHKQVTFCYDQESGLKAWEDAHKIGEKTPYMIGLISTYERIQYYSTNCIKTVSGESVFK